jgi:tetratricopeptide (TPR) repeat protein
MDIAGGINPDKFFVTSLQQQAQLEALSNNALSAGIDKYMKKDYEGAALEFKKSINLAPTSALSPDTTKYLAQTYLQLKETDKAIEAYKRGIELNRDRDDLRRDLGNLYYAEERYAEALAEYQEAVRVDPVSSSNHYSLGQGYLKMEKYSAAESEFRAVLRLEPNSPYGQYGQGLVLSQSQQFEQAIEKFQAAVRMDDKFYDAYAEIGYAYADMGEMDKAQEMVEFLEDKDAALATTLDLYMDKVEPPKILFAWGSSTFRYSLSVNTPVSSLDSYLETADAEKSLTMKFYFNKEMDRSSVENPLNWSISRADAVGFGKTYNFNQPIPDTEITLPSIPDYVLYDKLANTATVAFTVSQNATADGTIDPSHIVFKFSGEDVHGIEMDSDGDEFSGFSGVA